MLGDGEEVIDTDRRGVKRGKCKCGECEKYETTNKRVLSNCLYCDHVAPDHGELLFSQKIWCFSLSDH